MPKMQAIETGTHSPPVYVPADEEPPRPAELDRETHRALVDAGYASLATYVNRWGGKA